MAITEGTRTEDRTRHETIPIWLTVEETAKLLGLSPKTVLRGVPSRGASPRTPAAGISREPQGSAPHDGGREPLDAQL
jgi:hypothetical protein